MPNISFTSPYDTQQAELERRAAYAQALQQQGMEAPQGQMAGRMYVPPSPLQGLAKMLQAGVGAYGAKQTADKQTTLANERQQKMVEALKGYGTSGNAGALLENPDTAGYGVQGMMSERQAQMAAQLAADKASEDRRWRTEQEANKQKFQAEQNELNRETRMQAAQMGGGQGTPYYQFLPGADGYLVGNARTGQIAPGMVDGQRAIPGALDPALQGELAGAKAGGKVEGESAAQARVNLPKIVAGADQTAGLIQQILDHPGLSDAVGMKGASMGFGAFNSAVPGTEAADFNAKLGQLTGKQFLEAFESLKGGGQITEVEGTKATNAIAAMQTAQSEKQFKQSAQEFLGVVEAAKRRAIAKAQGQSSGATGEFGGAPEGGLTPEEAAELADLRKRFGR